MEVLQWKVAADIRDRVKAHIVEVHDARVRDTGRAFAELVALGEQLRDGTSGEIPIGQVEGIAEARSLYRSFGVDPTRTRPSSEALLRRCRKGQEFYRINEAVDVGNWVSLEFLLPLGLYDRSRISGPEALVRTGNEGEEYAGIRKGPVHVGGRLCVSDAEGAFGSPTSDSLRTSVGEAAAALTAIVFAPPEIDPGRLAAAGHALASRLAEHCEGRVVVDQALDA